jgi:hypothetical protein
MNCHTAGKMTSTRRIQSSRANGARSRGPVTEQGKKASSQNGLRHGMLAQTVVLEGESKDRFGALLQALVAEFQPCTESETAFVEIMAVARWRQMRIWGIGKSDFDREMANQDGPPPVRASIAFRFLCDHSRSLDLAHRYETGYERQFARALKNLLHLQASRGDIATPPYIPTAGPGATWEDVGPASAEKPIFDANPVPKPDTSP